MTRVLMSSAAAALWRGILARSEVPSERVLLTDVYSVDWQSLTMIGERHQIGLRIAGPRAFELAVRLCDGLGEAEFAIAGQIVADVAVAAGPTQSPDGAVTMTIEALTISD